MSDLLSIIGLILFIAWLISGCSNCITINHEKTTTKYCIGEAE
jgi:PBP1b-binding outer membrane lipoprotein LpoB